MNFIFYFCHVHVTHELYHFSLNDRLTVYDDFDVKFYLIGYEVDFDFLLVVHFVRSWCQNSFKECDFSCVDEVVLGVFFMPSLLCEVFFQVNVFPFIYRLNDFLGIQE